MKRLNSLYRRAAKLILPNPYLSTEHKLRDLKILPLAQHLKFNKGILMHKVWTSSVPSYISNLFTQQKSRSRLDFCIPRPRIDLYKTSLSYSGSHLWNSLPNHVKICPSLSCFKKNLFRYLFQLQKPP